MTYQHAFLLDRYAQAVVAMRTPNMHEAAWVLMRMDGERLKAKGRRMTDDHLRQVAGKL